MEYDQLGGFFAWWYQKRPFMPPTIGEVVQVTDVSMSSIVYRSDDFQVQYVTYSPNSIVATHRHANVDNILVYGSGDVNFRRNNEPQLVCNTPGQEIIRIKPEDWHSVEFGPRGGAFYSIQHWLDSKPGFVLDDWEFKNKEETRKAHHGIT